MDKVLQTLYESGVVLAVTGVACRWLFGLVLCTKNAKRRRKAISWELRRVVAATRDDFNARGTFNSGMRKTTEEHWGERAREFGNRMFVEGWLGNNAYSEQLLDQFRGEVTAEIDRLSRMRGERERNRHLEEIARKLPEPQIRSMFTS